MLRPRPRPWPPPQLARLRRPRLASLSLALSLQQPLTALRTLAQRRLLLYLARYYRSDKGQTIEEPPADDVPRHTAARWLASATSAVVEVERADAAATAPLTPTPTPTPTPPSVHDYSCPICLELLLRPVVLSCGHRFCRGCWLRVLQGPDVRATAHRTGSVACPFRCDVRPVVPEVDQAFTIEVLGSLCDSSSAGRLKCTGRASAHVLAEEERGTTEVNAWAAAGCKLDSPEETARIAEAALATTTTLMTARAERAHWGAQQLLRALARLMAGLSMLLCMTVGMLLIMMALARMRGDIRESKFTVVAMHTLIALSVWLGVFEACLVVLSLALVVRIIRLRQTRL